MQRQEYFSLGLALLGIVLNFIDRLLAKLDMTVPPFISMFLAWLGVIAIVVAAGLFGFGLWPPLLQNRWPRVMFVVIAAAIIFGSGDLLRTRYINETSQRPQSAVASMSASTEAAPMPGATPTPVRSPAKWGFDSFLAMSGPPLRFSGFQAWGTNVSPSPISRVSGFVRSNLTNETFPLFMVVNGLPLPPDETRGIPLGARFNIAVPFGPNTYSSEGMLDEDTFLRKFGDFTFVVELDGHREEHRFTWDRIQTLLSDFKRRAYDTTPAVTKKEKNPDAATH